MIDAEKALTIAQAHTASFVQSTDLLFGSWANGHWETPVLVCTVLGHPSYWLASVRLQGVVIGFVRVSGKGRVMATGTFCRDHRNLATCPKVVTGISDEEAQQKLAGNIVLEPGEEPGPPLFVHDGPEGREAWMVTTILHKKPKRWIFITAGGTYQRPAGIVLEDEIEA